MSLYFILLAMFINILYIIINTVDSNVLPSSEASVIQKHFNDNINIKQKFNHHNIKTIGDIIMSLKKSYDISLHYQNSTNALIDSIGNYNTQSIFILFNHDVPISKNISKRVRPFLYVIILDNPLKFSDIYYNEVHPSDVILYICIDNIFFEICKNQNEWITSPLISKKMIMKIFSVYYLKISNHNNILYDICIYCGKRSEIFHLMHKASIDAESSDTIDVIKNSISRQYHNFNGHLFKIGFTSGEFYFQCRSPDTHSRPNGEIVTTCGQKWGAEGDTLDELAKRMNFRTEFVTGPRKGKIGQWSKTIIDVNASYVDWAIGGITISEDRSKKVEFSVSFGDDPMRVLYSIPDDVFATGLDMVLAFHWLTWFALLLIIIILSALLRFSSKIAYFQSFQIYTSILIEQCVEGARKLHGRLFVISWMACCVIISTAYKAKLSALMVNPRQIPSVNMDVLIHNNYIAHLTYTDSDVVLKLLSASSDPALKKLSQNTRNDLVLCESIKDTLHTKSMVIEEQIPLLVTFSTECFPKMTEDQFSRLRLTTDILLPAGHAWPFRKDSPYMDAINLNILRIFQSGIYDKWITNYLEECGKGVAYIFRGVPKTYKVYGLKQFMGPIIAWTVGISISIFCFFVEFIYYKL